MPGSTFGTIFRITTWGESHGKGIGVVIDGCPAGLPLDQKQVQGISEPEKTGAEPLFNPAYGGRSGGDPVRCLRGKDHRDAPFP